MSKNKSTLTILYLSGETYTIDNVVDYKPVGVSSGFAFYLGEKPVFSDKTTHLMVKSYNPKRKVDMTQNIPTADIELFIVREKGGRRIEAVRLHRKKGNNGQRVYLDI